ncbi:cation channel family protein [Stylonychia lemnae]|uniref:BK channel n=1 Tax=Stylonychia lemnae TaxID=5949 RepID=A0A078AQK5_STYLE|nr:cation channel family protein [Stylonychia lemnae]|eukprot:CDW84459.1 cation channel family protein [Stylonychia lemnae]
MKSKKKKGSFGSNVALLFQKNYHNKRPLTEAEIIEEEFENSGQGQLPATISLKKQMHKLINSNQFSVPMDSINCILSISISCLYIYSTYDPLTFAKEMWGHWHPIFLSFCHMYFLIEYLLRLYTAKNLSAYLVSFENFLEILTIVPFMIVSQSQPDPLNFWSLFVRMLDLLRISTLFRALKYIENDINRELSRIIIGALTLVIGFSGYIQLIENRDDLISGDLTHYQSFFDTLFFIMTTISIVGYYSPVQSFEGKISIILLMAIVVIVIPSQSSKMIQLISSKSVYARRQYKSIDKIPHIVLIGSVSQITLFNFLEEYFHQDHGQHGRHCVIMMPQRPDPTFEMELMQSKYATSVFYIEGNPLDQRDLRRCLVEKSKAVVILSDKLSFDTQKEDTHTILQAMVIKNYLSSKTDKNQSAYTQICMQLLKPESITHYELSLNKEDLKNDQIVCIESMKLSLLAKSCLCPGLVVLITNLIKSSKNPPKEITDAVEQKKNNKHLEWLHDYWQGKTFEIYRIEIPSAYAEQTFSSIALEVYKDQKFVLFALEIVVNDTPNGEILLNPGAQKLPRPQGQNVTYTYFGYIIAPDKELAEQIFKKKGLTIKQAVTKNIEQSLMKHSKVTEPRNYFGMGTGENDNENDNVIQVENIEGDWLKMCHKASKEVLKQDIEFKTLQDSKLAENHIVICGMVENIRHFVMPLRADHLVDPSPIVILHDEELTGKQWQQLRYFSEIYFVKGSPLSESSYDRVNINKAKQVVILTPNVNKVARDKSFPGDQKKGNEPSQEDFQMSKDGETLLDAKTIFKYNIIKKKNPKVNVVTELISQDNIAFLLDNPLLYHLMKKYEYDQTPTFASGEVYLSSLMDSLLCQAYYNPALPTVLRQLIVGENKKKRKRNGSSTQSNGYGSINALLGDNSIIPDGDFSQIKTSNLYHLPVPPNFKGKPYAKLFSHLTKKRFMIPLGLYRTETVSFSAFDDEQQQKHPQRRKTMNGQSTAQSPSEQEIKYVVTNPEQDLELRLNDVVFVLAQADPRDHSAWEDLQNLNLSETQKPESNKDGRNREDDFFSNTENKYTQAEDEDIIEIKPNDQMQGQMQLINNFQSKVSQDRL